MTEKKQIEQALDTIVAEINNKHNSLVDEWIDYLPRVEFFVPVLHERDIPAVVDRICAKKVSFGKWWTVVDSYLRNLDRYRDQTSRFEAESFIRDPESWTLFAAGLADGHSFYIWHFKYSNVLGAISIHDREDDSITIRLLGV